MSIIKYYVMLIIIKSVGEVSSAGGFVQVLSLVRCGWLHMAWLCIIKNFKYIDFFLFELKFSSFA